MMFQKYLHPQNASGDCAKSQAREITRKLGKQFLAKQKAHFLEYFQEQKNVQMHTLTLKFKCFD